MKLNRNAMLILPLSITLMLVYWVSQQESDGSGDLLANPVNDSKKFSGPLKDTRQHRPQKNKLAWQVLENRVSIQKKNERTLFAAHGWYVAPPPPRPVKTEFVPIQPIMPAAPFVYIGKIENGPNGTEYYLSKGNKLLTIKLGENIDTNWRLVSEDANTLSVNYIQMNQIQRLPKNSKPVLAPVANTN